MKTTRILWVPTVASQAAPYVVVGLDGTILQRGSLSPDPVEPPTTMATIAVVPGSDVLVRWLDLPKGSQAQQKTAAIWKFRDELAADASGVTAAIGPEAAEGQPRLAVAVSVRILEAWLDYLRSLSIEVQAIVPDCLTLPEPFDDDRLSAIDLGGVMALRGKRFAATVQADLVEMIAAGRALEFDVSQEEAQRQMINGALAARVNLLDAVVTPVRPAQSWRRTAALALVVAASPLMFTIAAASRDDMAASSLKRQTLTRIEQAQPDLAQAPNPVDALHARAAAAPPPGGMVAAAAALYAAVEGVAGAELDMLVVDQGEGLKATIAHSQFSDVKAMSDAMRSSGLMLEETSTLEDGGRITSDVRVKAAQ